MTILGLLLLAGGAALAQESSPTQARVVVRSDPTGGNILLNETEPAGQAPDTLFLAPGEHVLQVGLEGYQYLTYKVQLEPGQLLDLEFILLPTPPDPKTPEELGLEYMPMIPIRHEKEADNKRSKFNSAAETFIVFPLVPGVIGMLAFDDSNDFPSEELFFSGLVLVAGSYFLGKISYNRELSEIQAANAEAEGPNAVVKQHNQEVDRAISDDHAIALLSWQSANEGRGVVVEGP
jgi:hypothetical protein